MPKVSPRLLINIDVPDLARGVAFYTVALGLTVGRRFGDDIAELLGAAVPVFLLAKPAGSRIGPGTGAVRGGERDYRRHWSPVHIDVAVDDLDAAIARAVAAGAVQEGDTADAPYGRQAMFADPFGHGFCLIEFNAEGYDALG